MRKFVLSLLIVLSVFTFNIQNASAGISNVLKVGESVCLIQNDKKVSCGTVEKIIRIGNTYHEKIFIKLSGAYYNLNWILRITK